MLKSIDRLYLIEIMKLIESKFTKIRLYGKISRFFFNISMHYKHKAEMMLLSGGRPQEFQNKIKNTMKKLNEMDEKQSIEFPNDVTRVVNNGAALSDLGGFQDLKEPKSNTYREAREKREPIELVPAKPGFFTMTEDVPVEKREALKKEVVPTVPKKELKNMGYGNKDTQKKSQARKFYYKRKRKKFDPTKFNNNNNKKDS